MRDVFFKRDWIQFCFQPDFGKALDLDRALILKRNEADTIGAEFVKQNEAGCVSIF